MTWPDLDKSYPSKNYSTFTSVAQLEWWKTLIEWETLFTSTLKSKNGVDKTVLITVVFLSTNAFIVCCETLYYQSYIKMAAGEIKKLRHSDLRIE